MGIEQISVAKTNRATSKAKPLDSPPFKGLNIALLGYRSKPHCGGQGVYLHYLSKALVTMGHRVDVISGEPYPVLDDRVRLIKMPGLNLFETNHVTALRPKHFKSATDLIEYFDMLSGGFPEPLTFGRRVVKYLKSHKTDYDIIHDNQSLGFGLLDIQKMGIPLVATIHHPIHKDLEIAMQSANGWKQRLPMQRWHAFLLMQNYVVKRLRHTVTVSQRSRQDIATHFEVPESSVDLVYNGIDTEVYKPFPEIRRKPFSLMTTASADVPLKGLDVLLEALAKLLPTYPRLHLLVIGRAAPGGKTETLINKLGLTHCVKFVTGVSDDEIVRYYAECTLAVSPSLYEGFGLPAGEAMACGVPLVSSNGGALPEVVGDAGVIVEAGDQLALAHAIETLLNDSNERKRLGRVARQRIVESFSWKVAANQMTDYYNRVIQSESTAKKQQQ